jgi:hypothetical protein
MDRDDAGMSDRSDEARKGDTGMIGSESEDPGPGRDTSLTDPDPVAASTDQPRGTVAMSEGDPMRTRLGSHVEGAGVIGYDVAAVEEGATEETPADDRPGYEPERSAGLAAEPVVDQGSYERDAVEDVRPSGGSVFDEGQLLARPGPQEPGVQEGIYDQEADQARRQRPSDGL